MVQEMENTQIIAFISQKGGVGKSTLARAVACEASKSDLSVKLADLDLQQGTSNAWHMVRLKKDYDSIGSVEIFKTASSAIQSIKKGDFDLLVIDGAPRASTGTLETARYADLIVLPCCASLDDLIPAIKLAGDLIKKGTPRQKIVFALVRVTTEAEIADSRDFIKQSGFTTLEGCLYEKPAYRQAQNDGLAVTETRYKSLNERANILLESILNHLMNE